MRPGDKRTAPQDLTVGDFVVWFSAHRRVFVAGRVVAVLPAGERLLKYDRFKETHKASFHWGPGARDEKSYLIEVRSGKYTRKVGDSRVPRHELHWPPTLGLRRVAFWRVDFARMEHDPDEGRRVTDFHMDVEYVAASRVLRVFLLVKLSGQEHIATSDPIPVEEVKRPAEGVKKCRMTRKD